MSGDLVNGDHLSIPGMRDYSYGSFGAYNQMSPSPKSVIPQSPSPAGMSYTVGKLQFSYFNPLSPKIHIQILQTDLHTFLLGIVEKIWFKIKALFFPVVINLVILITFTLNDLLMLFGEN